MFPENKDHSCASWTMLLGNNSFNSHIRRRNFELAAFKSPPCFPPYLLVIPLEPKIRPWPLLSSPSTFQQSESALSRAEWQIPSPDCKVLSQNRFHVHSDSGNMHKCRYMKDWPTQACSKACLAFYSPWFKTPHTLHWVGRAHSKSGVVSRWQITWQWVKSWAASLGSHCHRYRSRGTHLQPNDRCFPRHILLSLLEHKHTAYRRENVYFTVFSKPTVLGSKGVLDNWTETYRLFPIWDAENKNFTTNKKVNLSLAI